MSVSSATSTTNNKTLEDIIADGAKKTSKRNTGELGKDDFLNLMMTQLRYQDPLKPTEDKEFVAQMAQFSSLEQMQNMSLSLTQTQGFSLLNKHVTGSITDPKTFETKVIDGVVTAVKVSKGKTVVMIGDKELPLESVTKVTELTPQDILAVEKAAREALEAERQKAEENA